MPGQASAVSGLNLQRINDRHVMHDFAAIAANSLSHPLADAATPSQARLY
jgi:hypothetical protein